MLGGLVEGLISAWILIQFDVDRIFIEVIQPFVPKIELTRNHFYFVFSIIGVIGNVVYQIRKERR